MASLTTLLEGYLASTSMAMDQNIIKNIDVLDMYWIVLHLSHADIACRSQKKHYKFQSVLVPSTQASAKEVFVQAERTRKLLEKHGAQAWISQNWYGHNLRLFFVDHNDNGNISYRLHCSPEFLSVKANHGKTQECRTGILSILPCGQNQRNLRTIAELCIR